MTRLARMLVSPHHGMTFRGTNNPLAGRISGLVLDYGADALTCGDDAVEISERGMLVRARWQFTEGTELSVRLVCEGGACGDEPTRYTVEGIVVGCAPIARQPGFYESTILFWELPEPLRLALQERALAASTAE